MRRKEAGFIAAQAAIFVAVIALVSLPLQSANEQQASTSSAVAGSLTFTSGVSPQGLQLEATLNSSSIQSHGAISARVEVLNTLNRNVTLSGLAQNQNILEWSGDDYVCNSPSTIVGFALFQGHFAAGNISAAGQPLQLAPPEVIYGCQGAGGPGQVGTVTFLPEGDQAVATTDFQGIYEGSQPVTVSVNATTGDCVDNPELVGFCTGKGLSGYWNDSIPAPGALNFTSPAFAYFPPGEYTIAATDLWDQYVYATFVVEPPQTITFASGASPDGLRLELTLNATTMPSDGAITGQVAVVNTSNQNVTVSNLSPSQNVTEWSNYINVCPSDYFMGYSVFEGHFTAANISSAGTPLRLVPPMDLICPPPIGPSAITFLPSRGQATNRVVDSDEPSYLVSDQLNATTLFCNTTEANQNSFACDLATPGLVGYWNGSAPVGAGANFGFTSPAFSHFSPGEYTVVAWDDWNQYVYATFVVQPVDSSQSSPALAASCFVSIPAGAQLGLFANSTFNGDNVTYANGTSFLFSNYSCPRPAFGGSSQGADVYAMAVATVRNSSFVAAENGSEFLFQEPSGLSCSTIGTQQCSMTLFFYHYGENGTLFRCGGGLDANLASMLYRRDALAGITVTFYTVGQAGPDGVSNSTAWNLRDPTIQAMPAGQVTQYYESSYPCG